MGEVVNTVRISEPNVWFLVFHRKSTNRVLSFLAFGEFKHVAAFGYCPRVGMWLVYDVTWTGTRVVLMDKAAIIEWTRGCEILQVDKIGARMGWSSRIGFYCVGAVKHLLGLRCVAATPCQLYRHILRNGGVNIGSGQPAPAAADAT